MRRHVEEPSARELRAIEREWPEIAADLIMLDAEIEGLLAGPVLVATCDWCGCAVTKCARSAAGCGCNCVSCGCLSSCELLAAANELVGVG